MVKLKICGMKRLEDIEIVNKYKPDYIGFVFTESPRKVSYEQAKELSNSLSEDVVPVGVFVNEHMKLIVDGTTEIRDDAENSNRAGESGCISVDLVAVC